MALPAAIVVTAVMGVGAAAALAADQPAAYGVAQQGSLKVVADVLFMPKGGEMKGVWLDTSRPCRERRRLTVRIQIDLVRSDGSTKRARFVRFGMVDNCAEGGPNFGFDLRPKALRMACPNGRWLPGRYSMTTRAVEGRVALSASASLYHQVTQPCP